jgi:prolyl 4-hydroxylase
VRTFPFPETANIKFWNALKNAHLDSKATYLSKTLKISKLYGISSSKTIVSNITRYKKGHYFREHFDWFDPARDTSLDESGNRLSSFFIYLLADCEGGTTSFPKVKRPKAPEWCSILKCQDDKGNEIETVEVKATQGTAIFWHNFETSGKLDEMTLHAGTDVFNGTKIGLNIWTREKRFR